MTPLELTGVEALAAGVAGGCALVVMALLTRKVLLSLSYGAMIAFGMVAILYVV